MRKKILAASMSVMFLLTLGFGVIQASSIAKITQTEKSAYWIGDHVRYWYLLGDDVTKLTGEIDIIYHDWGGNEQYICYYGEAEIALDGEGDYIEFVGKIWCDSRGNTEYSYGLVVWDDFEQKIGVYSNPREDKLCWKIICEGNGTVCAELTTPSGSTVCEVDWNVQSYEIGYVSSSSEFNYMSEKKGKPEKLSVYVRYQDAVQNGVEKDFDKVVLRETYDGDSTYSKVDHMDIRDLTLGGTGI